MTKDLLEKERRYLAQLLEAIQRSAYFLFKSESKLHWPLHGKDLAEHNKDVDLFETLSAINERFAKLQDTLAAAMRHSVLLMSEPTDSFLKVLAFLEKSGVISSIEDWQRSRAARNLAAHDYETNYQVIAEHFNALHSISGMLYHTAQRLLEHCEQHLKILPATNDFDKEFAAVIHSWQAS